MILVNGDSITYGHGLEDKQHSWPNLVFKNFKNIAQPGSSNFSIYRRSLEELYRNKYTDIVIGWSSLFRLEIADNFSKPKNLIPYRSDTILGKEIVKNYLGKYWYFKNSLLAVHQLNLVARQHGVRLHCFNFATDTAEMYSVASSYAIFKKLFKLDLYSDREIRHEFIIVQKLIRDNLTTWSCDPVICLRDNYDKLKQYVSDVDYHPNAAGHRTIADEINNYLKI